MASCSEHFIRLRRKPWGSTTHGHVIEATGVTGEDVFTAPKGSWRNQAVGDGIFGQISCGMEPKLFGDSGFVKLHGFD